MIAATVEESTPPDIATTTVVSDGFLPIPIKETTISIIIDNKISPQSQQTDAIESYFECVTACSLNDEDIECTTRCIEIHLKHESE